MRHIIDFQSYYLRSTAARFEPVLEVCLSRYLYIAKYNILVYLNYRMRKPESLRPMPRVKYFTYIVTILRVHIMSDFPVHKTASFISNRVIQKYTARKIYNAGSPFALLQCILVELNLYITRAKVIREALYKPRHNGIFF